MFLCFYVLVPLFLFTLVSLFRCFFLSIFHVSIFLCFFVPCFLCFDVSLFLFLCSYVSLFLCFFVSLFFCFFVSLFKFSEGPHQSLLVFNILTEVNVSRLRNRTTFTAQWGRYFRTRSGGIFRCQSVALWNR